jgi:two-component system phosphate regulon sensor histidine kinase PhoR
MRKRLMIVNALIIFFSLLCLLFFSCLIITQENNANSQKSLRGYLSVGKKTLASEMALEDANSAIKDMSTALTSSNSSIRVTVIGLEGKVIADTFKDSIEENHLSRPEIQNLGTIYYRYSETLKENMMYLASLDESSQYYVRVAMPGADISATVNQFILYGSLSLVGVLALSLVSSWLLTKRALEPLKEQADKLSAIIASPAPLPKGDEMDNISYQIDKADELIKEKISSLTEETSKLSFILDSMTQGLMAVDAKENIILVNKAALSLLKANPGDYAGQKLESLVINPDLLAAYQQASSQQKESSFAYAAPDGRYYLFSAYPLSEPWCADGVRFGVGLSFADITKEKALETAKKDFFANASHELKSPLTSIIGYSEMVRSGIITSKEDTAQALDRVLAESKRMNQIIIQMLQLSELESAASAPKENLSLLAVCQEAVTSLADEAKKADIAVKVSGEDFTVSMPKDEAFSLVKNLLENAVRYNREHGWVELTLDQEKKTLAVTDNGIGIAPMDQERIFERFYRVDKAKSRKLGGTGLGLSIVKHICLNCHLTVKVESKLGQGSKFTVSF